MSSSHTKTQIIECHQRIKSFIHRTPILTSQLLNEMIGGELFFKCENFQRMGAFKMRGASHAILNLSKEQQDRGVVTHSSGNFGQAVALSAKTLGVDAYIVMPENAPKVKREAVMDYGAKVCICPSTIEARQNAAQEIVDKQGASFLHPSNDMNVILGNSTAAYELLLDHPELDYIIAPVGGGGLLAGTALAVHNFGKTGSICLGAEPALSDDAFRSLRDGIIHTDTNSGTVADGLRTHLGNINFPIIQKHVSDILLVDENEIIEAMKLIWERLKIIAEASSSVPLGAILKHADMFANKKTAVIISGGNVDLSHLPF